MCQTITRSRRYWAGLVTLVLIGLGLFGYGVPTHAQSDDTVKMVFLVEPPSGDAAKVLFHVTLTMTGDASRCPATVISTPSDTLLVVDRSESMTESAGAGLGSKLDLLKGAAKAFLQQVDLSRDRVGVVEFDSLAFVDVEPTQDSARLTAAINNIRVGSGTSISLGVEQAARQFAIEEQRNAGRRQVMVLLSDGKSDVPSTEQATLAAQRAGVRIITIALGSNADQDLLRKIASQPSDFYVVKDPNQLLQVYETIAKEIRKPIAALDLLVTHALNMSAIEVDPASITGSGTLSGDQIVWKVPEQLGAPIKLSYTAKPRAPGTFTLDHTTQIAYLRCEVDSRQISLPAALSVIAQPPPSPTLTPTLPPTMTPAPTPLPTATPTLRESLQQGAAGMICNSDWIMLLLWIVALALTAWFVWQFIQALRIANDPDPQSNGKPIRPRSPCRWLLWLWLPLFLILLTFLLPILVGPGCGARESVYFWRISSGQRDGSIYIANANDGKPAHPLTASNRGTCVGCHAVSSQTYQIASIVGGGVGTVEVRSLDGHLVATPNVTGSYIAWSPDGKKLAVSTGDQQLVIVDLVSGSVTPLKGASDPSVAQVMPAWSPDGQTITFVRGPRTAQAWVVEGSSDIYTVPATGGQPQPIIGASGAGFNYYPSYSPDGRWIAFTHHLSGTTTYAAPEAEIYLVPTTGGVPQRLAANNDPNGQPLVNASNSWPTWSRDGRYLAFTSKRNDPSYDIFITTIDANGNSGPAQPLVSASQAGVFEHLPFWGVPPTVDPWTAIISLWPCLIPFLLVLLAWLICRRRKTDPPPITVEPLPPPDPLDAASLYPLWQVAPSLIVGVGGTGRWVLTHLKKTLRDGGGGALPPHVKFVLLDTAEREQATQFRDARGEITRVSFACISLDANEVFLLDQSVRDLLTHVREHGDTALADWVPEAYAKLGREALSLATGTSGRRPVARIGLIDKLRQGADRGQATPLSLGAVASDASNLWPTLLDACTAVKDNDQIRIVMVGSLAGGMSGTLYDLAYLASRAARKVLGGNKVYLDGYLATAGAFGGQPGADLPRMQLNTMAALRELQRFQLYQGAPIRFDYAPDATSSREPLTGSLTWPLFDTVTLFGDQVNPERDGVSGAQKKSSEPWATTYASMADTIAFRLERAVAQALDMNRGKTVTDIATRQQEVQQTVVGSAGTFVYRLPLVDILEIIRARWAFALLNMFLGDDSQGQNPARAQRLATVQHEAERFVLAESEAGVAPHGMRTAGLLGIDARVPARRIVNFGSDDGRPFADYLNHGLLLILQNATGRGQGGSSGPRIDDARTFIVAVIGLLSKALAKAEQQQTAAPTTTSFWQQILVWLGYGHASRAEWERVTSRLTIWLTITRQTEKSLREIYTLIYGTDDTGTSERFLGLYREVQNNQALCEQRREQMDQVAVRRYLWSVPASPDQPTDDSQIAQDLVDQWYPKAAERLRSYLARFHWSMRSDGMILFGIDREKIPVQKADQETVQALIKAINDLAIHATHDLAVVVREGGLRQTSELVYEIKDVLQSQIPSNVDRTEERLIEQIWPIAQPHLDPARDTNDDVDGVVSGLTGVPDNVKDDPRFARLIAVFSALGTRNTRVERVPMKDQALTKIITTKDRTALVLMREYVRMPMLRVKEMEEALKIYARNAGQIVERGQDSTTDSTVFQAEAHALMYERRLESSLFEKEDFRLLHPLIVTALERPEVVRPFGLALAAGWLQVTADQHVLLHIPGQMPTRLERLQEVTGAHALVQALLALTTRVGSHAVLEQLSAALKEPSVETQAAWQRFIQRYQPRVAAATQLAAPQAVVPLRCANPECQSELKPGAKFCSKCRTPVPQSVVPQSVVPQPVVPPLLGAPFAEEGQAVRDLAVVAALEVARMINQSGWDGLVMRQPRKLK